MELVELQTHHSNDLTITNVVIAFSYKFYVFSFLFWKPISIKSSKLKTNKQIKRNNPKNVETNHESWSNRQMKVLTKSFQTPPTSKPKRTHTETSGDEEEHAISLPTQRVTPSERSASDAKSTISDPIKPASKKSDGSVSYQLSISSFKSISFSLTTVEMHLS